MSEWFASFQVYWLVNKLMVIAYYMFKLKSINKERERELWPPSTNNRE